MTKLLYIRPLHNFCIIQPRSSVADLSILYIRCTPPHPSLCFLHAEKSTLVYSDALMKPSRPPLTQSSCTLLPIAPAL
jgi:hypothetical protein